MTAVDKTTASDAEFRARIARFEGADEPAEVVDAVVDNIADKYRDPTLARFAINDFRDWLAARAMPTSRAEEALREFAEWAVALDDDDPESPGRIERRTVTLNQIVGKARAALSAPLAGQHTTDEVADDV